MDASRKTWPRAIVAASLGMTLFFLAACSGAGESSAEPGEGVPDPVAYIRSVYADEAAGAQVGASTATDGDAGSRESRQRGARESIIETYGMKAAHSTPRLAALFEDDAKYARGEIGRLGFNYFTGAQDSELSDVNITGSDVDGAPDRKVVIAQFKNMGNPVSIQFYFEKIGDAWYIDDVSSQGYLGADDPPAWTLSLLLKYGSH